MTFKKFVLYFKLVVLMLSVFHAIQEYYYWMNRGSSVTVNYILEVRKKLESVYLAMIPSA